MVEGKSGIDKCHVSHPNKRHPGHLPGLPGPIRSGTAEPGVNLRVNLARCCHASVNLGIQNQGCFHV